MFKIFNIINYLHLHQKRQRGAALMVMLVIVIVGAAAILLNSLTGITLRIERDKKTADALALAKQALVGYSASSNTPGQLPCPEDTAKIGGLYEGDADNSCSLPAVGRLPWRSLKTGPIRDANGELLWYAISDGFRTPPINSDSAAKLTIDGAVGSAVAIIFSAGAPINGQSRPVPTNLAPPNVTQYLDLSNNDGDNTFVTTGPDTTFNDRLLLVTHDDLFRVVEKRVAKELQNTTFAGYLAVNPARYPNPANISSCTIATCPSDTSQCRGWIPSFANFDNPSWILPSWFVSNGWNHLVYYSASSSRLASAPAGCNLIASGVPTQALFFMTSSQLATQTRPSNNVQDYLEDLENYNMDNM